VHSRCKSKVLKTGGTKSEAKFEVFMAVKGEWCTDDEDQEHLPMLNFDIKIKKLFGRESVIEGKNFLTCISPPW